MVFSPKKHSGMSNLHDSYSKIPALLHELDPMDNFLKEPLNKCRYLLAFRHLRYQGVRLQEDRLSCKTWQRGEREYLKAPQARPKLPSAALFLLRRAATIRCEKRNVLRAERFGLAQKSFALIQRFLKTL